MITNRYPYERVLTASLVLGVSSLGAIAVLNFIDLGGRLERSLFYASFLVLVFSALVYNIYSAHKGRWLFQALKRRRDRPS